MAILEYIDIEGVRYDLSDKEAVHKTEWLDLIYPVGSIYMNVNNVDPSVIFGGEWAPIQDRFILSSGSKVSGVTGGYKDAVVVSHSHSVSGSVGSAGSHSHTVNSSGAHIHSMYNIWSNGTGKYDAYVYQGNRKLQTRYTASAGSHTHSINAAGSHSHSLSVTSGTTGSSGVDRNMPPYLVVNVWKRIS